MISQRPSMVILAGPNGAGKSTLYANRVSPVVAGPFINADDIQREELEDPRYEASLAAAKLADERRHHHFTHKTSFATETVFSHPSKLDLVREAQSYGFNVVLIHVSVEDPEILLDRVSSRVSKGGHGVPDDKILSRYKRNGPLIPQAALISDRAEILDNSHT